MRLPARLRRLARTWDYLFSTPSNRTEARSRLRLESLEVREVPSVTVYSRDFNPSTSATLAPGVTAAWSNTTKPSTPSGESFLGEFGNQTVTFNLNNIPAHNQLTVEFDLYVIRSWDGNDPTWGGPNGDRWSFAADGATLLDTTFRNPRTLPSNDSGQEFGGQGVPGPAPFAPGTGAAAINTLGYTFNGGTGTQPLDAVYHFSFPISHVGQSLTLAFAGSGLQGLSDESWGLDNVKVTADTVPVVTVEKISDAEEGGTEGKFRFTRTGDTSQGLTANYSVGGTASLGTDYTALSGTVAFAPGSATADVIVTPKTDGAIEGDETVVATLAGSAGYVVGTSSSATVTIADVHPGGVAGTVWVDANTNGDRDAGESTLAGVTVSLLDENGDPAKDADGNVLGAVTTGNDGAYSFGDLFPRGYTVRFTAPTGYVLNGDGAEREETALAEPDQTVVLDLPAYPDTQVSSVSGTVRAYSASGDADAPGLAGVTVSLLDENGDAAADADGNSVADVTTDGTGTYSFANLLPGTYTVRFTAPSGYLMSGSDAATQSEAALTPGPNATVNASAYQPATLSGTVWVDADQDGAVGTGEDRLPGVTVEVVTSAGDTIATTATGADGTYSIAGLPPGSYQLWFTAPTGYVLSGSSDTRLSFLALGSGEAATRDVAAYTSSASSSITGRVWIDTDGNGVQDTGESGLAGTSVAVISNGTTVATATSDASGNLSVAGLAPGTYTVQFAAPTGYVLAGSRATIWSTDVSTPGPNAVVKAAAYQPASVTGTVWVDADNNGTKDNGEVAVDGAKISFYGRDGKVAGTATADASGNFTASNLPPDVYRVAADAPASFVLNGLPASVWVPLPLTSGASATVPVALNTAAPNKNSIKYDQVTGKEFFDQLTQVAKTGDRKVARMVDEIKDFMGVDISKQADQVKWAKEKLIYGVVKDAGGARTGGGAATAVRLSVSDFGTAPEKTKAAIIQVLKFDIRVFDAQGNRIDEPDIYYAIEGFGVDANGVAKRLDEHAISGPVGYLFKGKKVARVEISQDFTSGWGINTKAVAQPKEFAYGEMDKEPAKGDINWLGTTTKYQVRYRLTAADGKWEFLDSSVDVSVEGTDNTITKN